MSVGLFNALEHDSKVAFSSSCLNLRLTRFTKTGNHWYYARLGVLANFNNACNEDNSAVLNETCYNWLQIAVNRYISSLTCLQMLMNGGCLGQDWF